MEAVTCEEVKETNAKDQSEIVTLKADGNDPEIVISEMKEEERQEEIEEEEEEAEEESVKKIVRGRRRQDKNVFYLNTSI